MSHTVRKRLLLMVCLCPLMWTACTRSTSSNALTTPTVTALSPDSGAALGGNAITITGTGFNLTSVVTVNGRNCTDLEHLSTTSLACIVPELVGGTTVSVTVDVVVTNRNFTTGDIAAGTLTGGYTYHPPPTVDSASQGFFLGGTTITIAGTGFRSGATVLIGSTDCPSVNVVSGLSLTCVNPAGTALATADVTVTNVDDQSETLTNGFTWRQVEFTTFVDGNGTDGVAKDATKNGLVSKLAELSSKLYMGWQESDGTADQIRVAVYNENDASPAWAFVDGNLATGINFNTGKSARNVDLIVNNSKLVAVWDEPEGTSNVRQIRAAQYGGDDNAPSWAFIDGGATTGLNRNTGRVAQTPRAVSTSANNIFAVFTEENSSIITQIRVKKYNGAAWSNFDTGNNENGLNVNPAKNATVPSIATLAGRMYLIWQEVNNSSVATIRTSCNEDQTTAAWTSIDGGVGLNRVAARHARYPRLTVYNNKIYATWVEEASASGPQQVRVARFDGANCSQTTWVFVDGNVAATGINKDPTRSAQYPMLSVLSTFLYAAWAETDGTATNIRVKQLSNEGTGAWTFVDGDGASGINKSTSQNAANPFLLSHSSQFYNTWYESNGVNTTIRVKLGD